MILNLYREPFEPPLLDKLAEALKTDRKITIYLSSEGGKNSILSAALDMVNSNKERFEIIAYDYIGSAAFVFFIKAQCLKRILPNILAMHHQSRTCVDLDEFKKPYYKSDEAVIIQIKKEREDSMIFNERIGLTPVELKRYHQNDDLYFQYDRLLELLENYNSY